MAKWKIAGTEVKGKKHINSGKPCQDKIYSSNNGKISLIALADGAGSATHSNIGASLSTIVTSRIFENMFDNLYQLNEYEIAKVISTNIIRLLTKKSCELGIELKDLSSTLLFVALRKGKYIAGHLGDGVIGKLEEDQTLSVLSHPDNGEYMNQTYFTTSTDVLTHIRIYKGYIKEETGFILMSDGSAESLYDRKSKTLSKVSSQMMNWLENNTEKEVSQALFENIKQFFLNKTTDDCSINMMKRVTGIDIIDKVGRWLKKLRIWFKDTPDNKLIQKDLSIN